MRSELSAELDQVVRGRNVIVLAVVNVDLFIIANVAYGGGNQHGLRNISNVTWAVFLVGFVVLVLFGIAHLVQVMQRRGRCTRNVTNQEYPFRPAPAPPTCGLARPLKCEDLTPSRRPHHEAWA